MGVSIAFVNCHSFNRKEKGKTTVDGCYRCRYTLDGYLGELQGGVTYIKTVKQLLEQAENDWPSLLARLQRIRATILHKKSFLVNLTGDQVSLLMLLCC